MMAEGDEKAGFTPAILPLMGLEVNSKRLAAGDRLSAGTKGNFDALPLEELSDNVTISLG